MNKNELITQQADEAWRALHAVLALYNINYGYDYTDVAVNNSIMLMTYSLRMVNTSKWRKLNGLTDEITQAMQLVNADDRVRIGFEGLDYRIEVPKPKSLHNTVSVGDVFSSSEGLKVSLGVSAYNNTPNRVDFSRDTSGHMMVSGSTRCGKTNVLKLIILSLMYKTTPDQIRLAIIDTVKAKGKYGMLQNATHLATDILDTEPKAVAFLRWAKDTIVKQQGRKFEHRVVIVIDEVYLLLKNKEAKDLLSYVATAGAEIGFHIIAATQYAKADDIGGRQFKGNLMTRVCGRVDDHYSSKNATGVDGAGANTLMTPGDFLMIDDSGIDRIAVPEVLDKHFSRVKRGLSPIMTLNWDESDAGMIPDLTGRGPSVATCFDKIDPRLLHLAITGKRNGRFLGADVIRRASRVLAKRGMGSSIGNNVANEYVKFGKRYRAVK